MAPDGENKSSLTLVLALGTLSSCWAVLSNFNMTVFVSSYPVLSCLILPLKSLFFSNETQKRSGSRGEGRGRTGRNRAMRNCNQDILHEKIIYF